MSPQQALSLLDQAVAMLSLNRVDHAKLVEAVQLLAKLTETPAAA